MGPHGVDDGFVRFGVFELDLRQRELRRQGRRVHLQDKPFELLAYLISRPGQLVSRDELQRQLWPADTFV
ncbi:MAG: winged helix-turn-helix transcriptional regulator, partial [Acidobacteria bacterium]|nr:winged helix-turn-helix transcriptional regulator [Acidobacteriota bacterium]